jgi:hypothetical protein
VLEIDSLIENNKEHAESHDKSSDRDSETNKINNIDITLDGQSQIDLNNRTAYCGAPQVYYIL